MSNKRDAEIEEEMTICEGSVLLGITDLEVTREMEIWGNKD